MNCKKPIFYIISGVLAAVILSCTAGTSPALQDLSTSTATVSQVDRESKIPAGAVKMSPATDEHPLLVYSEDYEEPVPVPGEINTAGAEDSPFVTEDGNTIYFFFTPDVSVPVEKQILDGVTGIYVSKKVNGVWGRPERVVLQEPGKLAGDGCALVRGNTLWFCSVREGYTGVNWFTAEYKDGRWQNWKIADIPDYKVGELHITADGMELYFGSDRPGGKGNLDIWVSRNIQGEWQEPVNVAAVNTADGEGWPAVSPDGNELWFTRNYGIWRSKKANGEWQEAELVLSPLAGEPSIDDAGNLYFVHHFYVNEKMIEADIYVAYKKK